MSETKKIKTELSFTNSELAKLPLDIIKYLCTFLNIKDLVSLHASSKWFKQNIQVELFKRIKEHLIKKIVHADRHVFFLMENGLLWAMGRNDNGELGLSGASFSEPTLIPDLKVKDIITYKSCTAFISNDDRLLVCGRLLCKDFGKNFHLLSSNIKFKKIVIGEGHIVCLSNAGKVYVYGSNALGQLGLGSDRKARFELTLIPSIDEVENIFVGGFETFLVKKDGSLFACGNNAFGKLGVDSDESCFTPKKVENVQHVVDINANHMRTGFILKDGTVWISGFNSFGQYNKQNDGKKPIQLRIPNVLHMKSNLYETFFITTKFEIWHCVENDSSEEINKPVRMNQFNDVKDIALTNHCYVLLLKDDKILLKSSKNGFYTSNNLSDFSDVKQVCINNNFVIIQKNDLSVMTVAHQIRMLIGFSYQISFDDPRSHTILNKWSQAINKLQQKEINQNISNYDKILK